MFGEWIGENPFLSADDAALAWLEASKPSIFLNLVIAATQERTFLTAAHLYPRLNSHEICLVKLAKLLNRKKL